MTSEFANGFLCCYFLVLGWMFIDHMEFKHRFKYLEFEREVKKELEKEKNNNE